MGADFLAANNLLVDVAGRRLLDGDNFSHLPLRQCADVGAVSFSVSHDRFSVICDKFPEVFRPELRHIPGKVIRHDVVHRIETTCRPIHSRFRRLSPEKLAVARASFEEMVRMGVCVRASSEWSSPLHMVPKADGSLRPCGDYRLVNRFTAPDRYPLPNLRDFTANLDGCRFFSKLDLLKGYFQIPVQKEDVPKTTISTPFGAFFFFICLSVCEIVVLPSRN